MIVAIYHHSTARILLADSDRPDLPPLPIPLDTAREIAEAILGAVRAPELATAIASDSR